MKKTSALAKKMTATTKEMTQLSKKVTAVTKIRGWGYLEGGYPPCEGVEGTFSCVCGLHSPVQPSKNEVSPVKR
ncbi:MAG: hypothetical protein RIG68_12875 [Imperialibacter sp.]|uniref:hypothetical protein n=1 Tax=Imperialibacter sp. TaxID=2038411 RepID=UPI0032ED164F